MYRGSVGIGKGPPIIYSECDRSPRQSDIGVELRDGLFCQLHEYVTNILEGDRVIAIDMKDVAPMSSRWSVDSGHSCVSTFTVFGWKSDILSSIGPRDMGNGLGPESDQFLTIWVMLSTICR